MENYGLRVIIDVGAILKGLTTNVRKESTSDPALKTNAVSKCNMKGLTKN